MMISTSVLREDSTLGVEPAGKSNLKSFSVVATISAGFIRCSSPRRVLRDAHSFLVTDRPPDVPEKFSEDRCELLSVGVMHYRDAAHRNPCLVELGLQILPLKISNCRRLPSGAILACPRSASAIAASSRTLLFRRCGALLLFTQLRLRFGKVRLQNQQSRGLPLVYAVARPDAPAPKTNVTATSATEPHWKNEFQNPRSSRLSSRAVWKSSVILKANRKPGNDRNLNCRAWGADRQGRFAKTWG